MSIPVPGMYEDWQDWASAVKQELDLALTQYAPKETVGRVTSFKGTSVAPGYLLCDGSTFIQDTYPNLFLFLGTNVLPNLVSGFGAGYVVGIKI